MVPYTNQLKRIVSIFDSAKVKLSAEGLAEVLLSMQDGFGILSDNLPAEVVEHRVSRWLPVGAQVVNARLEELHVPMLVIAGEDDNMLPVRCRLSIMDSCVMSTCLAMSLTRCISAVYLYLHNYFHLPPLIHAKPSYYSHLFPTYRPRRKRHASLK